LEAKFKKLMEEEQTTFETPKQPVIKRSGLLWIVGIALTFCVLFIAFILGCYSTYAVNHLPKTPTVSPPAGGETVVLGKGIIEIQVQYYVPGNTITPFTVTATVSSYEYLAYPNGYRVLAIAPFSYVFNKIPQASQVTFLLVNPSPSLPQLAGLQGVQALTFAPYRVSGTGLSLVYYSVVMGRNVAISFLPTVIASVTTPYTLAVKDEIRFVAGIQSP
jgi:hypothetical protein